MAPVNLFQELKPTPASYTKTMRLIEKQENESLKPLNISILSTFTFDLIKPYLIVEGARRGLRLSPYIGPFNQLEQPIIDPQSPFNTSNPDIIILAARLEEITSDLIYRFIKLSQEEIDNKLEEIENRYQSLLEQIRSQHKAPILIFNFAAPTYLSAGLAETSLSLSQTAAIQKANQRLQALCRQFPDTYIFNLSHLVNQVGLQQWFDPKLWYLSRCPLSFDAQLAVGDHLSRNINAVISPPHKCLVLDLDNTLWGGVIGEEGLGGIALGEDYPGNTFKAFQRYIQSLSDRGIILAIASKNNENDAREVFEKHPDCLLKLSDFAAYQINWQDKATSLKDIADEINIGTNSLVFFDDNPTERAWIRLQMPEVAVIEVPQQPIDYIAALEKSGVFDHLTISDEDKKRSELYQKERQRKTLQNQSGSLDNFLQNLDMQIEIGYVDQNTQPRVVQLIGKTNQFNLTTRRHTSADLEKMINEGAVALWMRVKDRFGDNGLVGVIIAKPDNDQTWYIDTFLMSCRVIGRKVENSLLNQLSRILIEKGAAKIVGEYLPTAKNKPASTIYADLGFTQAAPNDPQYWEWDLSDGEEIPACDFIEVNFQHK